MKLKFKFSREQIIILNPLVCSLIAYASMDIVYIIGIWMGLSEMTSGFTLGIVTGMIMAGFFFYFAIDSQRRAYIRVLEKQLLARQLNITFEVSNKPPPIEGDEWKGRDGFNE